MMNKDWGTYAVAVLSLTLAGGVSMVGCNKSLLGDNLFSPEADMRITDMDTGSVDQFLEGNIVEVAAMGGGPEGDMPLNSLVFDAVNAELTVFNAVDVQLTRFTVEYFEEDGVTPIFVAPGVILSGFEGRLNEFITGGNLSSTSFTTLDSASDPNRAREGTVATETVNFDIVSQPFRNFLSGGDGAFGIENEAEGPNILPSPTRTFVTRLTVIGEDINGNTVTATGDVNVEVRIDFGEDMM